jgi:hypothetical protein
MNRSECIKMLLDCGAEDLSKDVYPNNKIKRFLKLKVGKATPITFQFDYGEYEELFVYSRRKKINKLMTFDEVSELILSLKKH